MKNMKRALRRHHQDRISAKCVRYLRDKTRFESWQDRWEWKTDENGKRYSVNVLVPNWREKYEEHIRVQAYHEASHRPHFCQMCKKPRYNRSKGR